MSQTLSVESKGESNAADAIMLGVVAMLFINILQRAVGLVRNLGFSLFLPEDQLGMWALANSFFVFAPPLIVLGLPGSFGKFVEHYRHRGQLRSYLFRVGRVCLGGLLLIGATILALPEQLSLSLYGQSQPYSIIVWTVVALACLTVHNFVYDVVLSMRLVRLLSIMQLVSSTAFCCLGVVGIYATRTWSILLPCYALSCLLAMVPGLYGISAARRDFEQTQVLRASEMWRRVIPFAAAMWMTNLLTNAFELCDRYMLLHIGNTLADSGPAIVGQYYCGRILPNLLLSLATMFSGIVLPYLSVDWERKQFSKITQVMNNVLLSMSIVLTGLSVAALAVAPLLFNGLLGSRFSAAFEILPLGMIQATWSGLAMIAANYLMCAEKGRQNAAILAGCLGLNIALNWPLIHGLGIHGAAIATATSNAVLLLVICWRLHREGCHINRSTLGICMLPISLIFGTYAAIGVFFVLAIICGRTNWLLSDCDRKMINAAVLPKLQRLGLSLETLWMRA